MLVVLGIVAAVAVPRLGGLSESAKVGAAREEMRRLKTSIIGAAGPDGVPRGGFEVDVGHPPGKLRDLAVKPDSVSNWNKFIGRGWNGPYVDSAATEYLRDPWDSTYQYDAGARTITSYGGGTNIVLSF